MPREVKFLFEEDDVEGSKYIFKTVKGRNVFRILITLGWTKGTLVKQVFTAELSEYSCGRFNELMRLCYLESQIKSTEELKQQLVDLALKIQRAGDR